jgi:hypothetical protein
MTRVQLQFIGLILGLATTGSDRAAGGELTWTKRALIVCRLPGDDEHRRVLAAAVAKFAVALTERCGFAAADIWLRFGGQLPHA